MDESGDAPNRVTVHGPGQFTGDVSQVTGRPAVVSGYARGATEVYEISQAALRSILNHHPDLADVKQEDFPSAPVAEPAVNTEQGVAEEKEPLLA